MSLPRFEPMLATPWPQPFSDPGWFFEVKWDGVRAMVTWDGARVVLRSRRGLDMTATYPEAAGGLLGRPCVLDAEIIALGKAGRPSFAALQQRLNLSGKTAVAEAARLNPVTLMVFDLLYDGEDVTGLPIETRRERLIAMDLPGPYVVPVAIEEHGLELYSALAARGLEGMVAKRRGSTYRPGVRSPDWRKIANMRTVRAVVGGFTPGVRGRSGTFGSLVVGLWDGARLRWVGSVGTGFGRSSLEAIRAALDEMAGSESPFHPDPGLPAGTTWVAPHLVARIEFKEWTRAGRLRSPSFKGFTGDPAEDVTWEAEGPDGLVTTG